MSVNNSDCTPTESSLSLEETNAEVNSKDDFKCQNISDLPSTMVIPSTVTSVEFVDEVENDMMFGVVLDESSDLDTDCDNKLQLYSGMDSSSSLITVVESDHIKTKEKYTRRKDQREPMRLSLDDRIKCIKICSKYGSYADAQKAWKQEYGVDPPCRRTISMIDKKFCKTGSVADLVRTGRPKSTRTEAAIAKVEEAVRNDPSKSIRSLAKDLGINQASVHRIKKAFEDNRNILKTENKKLKDKLNDALKRIIILERKLASNNNVTDENPSMSSMSSCMQPGTETLVITSPGTDHGNSSLLAAQLDGNYTSANLPTIIALNATAGNGQIAGPSVLRLQQHTGQDVIHIITFPQPNSSQLLLDESASLQLAISGDGNSSSHLVNFQTPVFTTCSDTID